MYFRRDCIKHMASSLLISARRNQEIAESPHGFGLSLMVSFKGIESTDSRFVRNATLIADICKSVLHVATFPLIVLGFFLILCPKLCSASLYT